MTATLVLPRVPSRRSAPRLASWWGRGLVRTVEEMAYDDAQLTGARALARSGRVGGLVVDAGRVVAAVEDAEGLWTASASVPVLRRADVEALVEVLGAAPGRRRAVLDGTLPPDVAEHAEEAGVELVPDTVSAVCTCGHWHAVCGHALGMLVQLAWAADADAGVLLHLRGLPRDRLLAAVEPPTAAPAAPARPAQQVDDVEVALDAALRASRLLEE